MRLAGAWLLVPCVLAANQPTFTFNLGPSCSGLCVKGIQVNAVATDRSGNTYLTGITNLTTLPVTSNAVQPQLAAGQCFFPFFGYNCGDAFVIKLDPTGAIVYATYFGGNGTDSGDAIAVDPQGNVYVAGVTSANDTGAANNFPVTSGAAFTTLGSSGTAAFVAKLNPSGQLVYSTFLPAYYTESGFPPLAMAVDAGESTYVALTSNPSGTLFPTTPGAFQTAPRAAPPRGGVVIVVAKLNPSGSALVYATYLSGSGRDNVAEDVAAGIAVDAAGEVVVAGETISTDFPVTPGAFQTKNLNSGQGGTGFVTKVNPDGTGLIYSTYLGGSTNDVALAVKVDAQGGATVLGETNSPDLATTEGLFPFTADCGFIARLAADGSSLIYSTFLPPATGLDLDSTGNAYVAGTTTTGSLPALVGPFQMSLTGGAGASDAYALKLTPAGQVAGATYVGESQIPIPTLIAAAPNGSVVISGSTFSSDFPGIGTISDQQVGATYVTSIFPSLTVVNAASYVPNTIAPGEIVSLLGYGIGPETGVIATGPVLPTELGGVQVSFGGFPAPLLYAQSHVINAQVPWELAGQTSTNVVVSYPGVASTPTPVVMAPSLPGIFYVSNSDGTQNSPSNPARPGDFITIYGTGGGPTNPGGVDGSFWPLTTPSPSLTLQVAVTIGSATASVLYAGASPLSSSGIFQINALLPSDLAASAASSLEVKIGGVPSVAVPIAIQ
jgi:uncharacterized protein (TIGR03437 family)